MYGIKTLKRESLLAISNVHYHKLKYTVNSSDVIGQLVQKIN